MVLTATQSEPRYSITMPGRISLPLSLAMPAVPIAVETAQRNGRASRAGRLQRFEPHLRRAFSGLALGRLEALHEGVEPGVAGASRLGHEMPFGGGGRIGRKTFATKWH